MATLLAPAFGNGSDGVLTISTNTTDSPIDSSCSGTAGSTSLSATNANFAAGQLILIHQSRGTGAGNWELNKIASYTPGTITTLLPLANTYMDSGASQAQVLVVKQYSQVNINSGATWTAKAWNGDTGGILAFTCNGKVTIAGTISALGRGYRGPLSDIGSNLPGKQGEGEAGPGGTVSTSRNGIGSGGATYYESGNINRTGKGPGGGHATAGQDTSNGNAQGGGTGGSADLTCMLFGGASGTGGTGADTHAHAGDGANGGGIIVLYAKEIAVTGSLNANGANGNNPYYGDQGASGSGAGGSVLIKGQKVVLGSNLIVAVAGTPGVDAGWGGVGRIRVEYQSLSGTTNPTASTAYKYFGSDYASII